MTRLILFLAIFISVDCFAQTKSYSEQDIYKLFKKSILQTEKGKIQIPSNPWVICNKDNSFFYKDTIIVFSNSYYKHTSNCCQYIAWTFYEKDKFVSTNIELCKEPTTASVTKDKDFYEILISSADNFLIISIFNPDKLSQGFKVESIDKIKQSNSDLTSTVLTLIRLK